MTNGKGRNTLPFNNNNINIFPEKNVKLLLEKQTLSVMQNAALLILCSWLKFCLLKCCVIKEIPLFIVMHQEEFLTLYLYTYII